MDYCAYDAEDIYVYLNNKKILDFLETDKIFFRWKESDISNNLIFYASNYGPKSYYKKINEIFKQRFSLENTQLNFVNRWLENRFSMKFFNFPDLESLILTYLNFGSLDRMENFTYPEDFKESRDDFIYAIDDWIDRSVDTAVRSELLTYSDAGLTVLELGNIFHCDLSSEYFDEALDIYNQTPDPIDTFEPIVTLSLYENLIMLSNCYIERASYNFSSGGSFKPFRNNSLIRSEPDVENLEKASIYLKDAEELFQPIKNDKEYLIAKTFFQFNKERINFLKGNKKFDENKLLEIFSYLIQNQEKVPALSWTPFIEELLFSYSSYLSVLTKMEMPTDNLIPSSELQQMLERINNLNALKYSQLLNNIDYKNLKKNYKENSKKILNLEKKGSEQNKEKLRLLYEDRKKIINKIYSIDEKFNDFKNSNFNNLDRFVKKLDEKEAIVSFQTSYSGIAITVKTRDESKIFFNHYTNKYQIEMFTSFLRNEIKNGGETGNFNFDWSFFLYIDLFSQVDGYLKGDYTIYIYGSELDDLPFATLISNPVGIEANRDISADDEIWDLEGSVADHLRNSSSYRKYMEADWLLNKYNFVRLYPVRAKSADIFDGKFLGFGNSVFLKTGLNDLPNVREEIEFLALASQSKKSIFFDEDASKENFIKMSEKNYERLAIATHSVEPFWNGLTTEPALIFNDSHKDFILSASEISTMDINSDMTILSVCNSDMTDFNAIYKSFLVAGSNSVIYTHWGVEDEAASKLTGDFFKRLWFDPEMKKHVALRKAILEMKSDLNDEKFAHPAFWGNFSLAYSSIN